MSLEYNANGVQVGDYYMQSLQNALNGYNKATGGTMGLQDFDKMINPNTYQQRWGSTANTTPAYTINTGNGVQAANQQVQQVQQQTGNPTYSAGVASPTTMPNHFTSGQDLSSLFGSYFKPYMDQINTSISNLGSLYKNNSGTQKSNQYGGSSLSNIYNPDYTSFNRGSMYFDPNSNNYRNYNQGGGNSNSVSGSF